MKKKLLIIFSAMFLLGCSHHTSIEPNEKSNLTAGVVTTQVIKGDTNKTEILQLFGSPNMITKNRADKEVWTYNKMSVDNRSSASGWTALFAGSSSTQRQSTTSSFDLILIFNDDEVLEDYSMISSTY